MHIAVDATCWHNKRGYGRHARALLRAAVGNDRDNQYTFVLDAPVGDELLPSTAQCHVVASSKPTAEAASASGRRGIRDMWRMSRALSKSDFDLVLFPTIYSYVPVLSRAKKVVLIHDVIAEKFPHLTLPSRLGRLFWKAKVALGRRQADALVTVSEHSRRGIVEYFGVAPDRVHVVSEAGDSAFRVLDNVTPSPRLCQLGIASDSRTIVYVGGFNPHKNLETLVAAFANIATCDDLSDVRLVLVGDYLNEVFHSYYGTIRRMVDELGLSQKVLFTGFLPDEDLALLLNRATVLALPSLLEGFGLPAIEAAACGCPVVATTASPLPDLLGDGGVFVDPLDRDGWETALTEVLRSPDRRAQLRQAGLKAAGQLTWDAAALQLLDVFQNVTGDQRATRSSRNEMCPVAS